jgi:hypothetical protein
MRIFWLNGSLSIQGQNNEEIEALTVLYRELLKPQPDSPINDCNIDGSEAAKSHLS